MRTTFGINLSQVRDGCIPQCAQALREDDDVVRAAHSLRSASSPQSTTVMEAPFQGADDDHVSVFEHICLLVQFLYDTSEEIQP